jgi:cytochrome c556
MKTPTPQDWANWAKYKSNKDRWIEREQERQDEIQEDTTSLEEKIKTLEKGK